MDPILTLREFPAYLQGQRTLPRYDAKQEKKPDDPWWRLDRASIDELMKELAQVITEQLKGSPDNDKESYASVKPGDCNRASHARQGAVVA